MNTTTTGLGKSFPTFASKEEADFYKDAWNRYLASKRTLEERISDSVQQKLECLGRVVRSKDSWSDTLIFPMKAGGVGKSLYKPMKPKKLTKLQRIKNKAFQAGRESRDQEMKNTEAWGENYRLRLIESERSLTIAEGKVKMLSGILQSVHTTAQAVADILRIS